MTFSSRTPSFALPCETETESAASKKFCTTESESDDIRIEGDSDFLHLKGIVASYAIFKH